MARDEFPELQPVALLLAGYESHWCMSVELGLDDFDGGAVYDWSVSDPHSHFKRRFERLADWLPFTADAIARGETTRYERADGPWLHAHGGVDPIYVAT